MVEVVCFSRKVKWSNDIFPPYRSKCTMLLLSSIKSFLWGSEKLCSRVSIRVSTYKNYTLQRYQDYFSCLHFSYVFPGLLLIGPFICLTQEMRFFQAWKDAKHTPGNWINQVSINIMPSPVIPHGHWVVPVGFLSI